MMCSPRIPESPIVAHPADHFDIFVPPLRESVLEKEIEFLQSVLGVRPANHRSN